MHAIPVFTAVTIVPATPGLSEKYDCRILVPGDHSRKRYDAADQVLPPLFYRSKYSKSDNQQYPHKCGHVISAGKQHRKQHRKHRPACFSPRVLPGKAEQHTQQQ